MTEPLRLFGQLTSAFHEQSPQAVDRLHASSVKKTQSSAAAADAASGAHAATSAAVATANVTRASRARGLPARDPVAMMSSWKMGCSSESARGGRCAGLTDTDACVWGEAGIEWRSTRVRYKELSGMAKKRLGEKGRGDRLQSRQGYHATRRRLPASASARAGGSAHLKMKFTLIVEKGCCRRV